MQKSVLWKGHSDSCAHDGYEGGLEAGVLGGSHPLTVCKDLEGEMVSLRVHHGFVTKRGEFNPLISWPMCYQFSKEAGLGGKGRI